MLRPRKLLKTVGKVAISALQTTGNISLETGKGAVSALQNLDKTVKASIIASIPQEIKDAIKHKQGKVFIPIPLIRTALREYFLQQKVTLVNLSLKQNQCLIFATTKKRGITVKIQVAVDIKEIEVKQLSPQETQVTPPEIYIKLVVVEPVNISSQGFWGTTILWIVENIGRGIFGIDTVPENLRDFRLAGNIISIPIQSLNLHKDWQKYLKYVEYVKEVKFVDNAVELTFNNPEWILEMLTDEQLPSA
ncbi:hypothetical protein H6G54_22205 [Anabaena cylindrica FACHB-243]|uniref:Uncharacterized protein n=1 Tax=Anabaena cylindrica (strain ATCC 27899 / PCC 7122) TaxID=272123 RepID=K9ZSL7_ANACC|nr:MULTISPECIES: hypothetical protein [Anabaena]AFZ61370.1 hypothetical protein Anacy_6099 [Anabaena cylindrica PCC 7122]MBD2420366.1 hypothetical protein [Anabaena cylindrica FACHB-243]MBY5281858.1 hypothetical protein [Anabaena sp. CCAP 1446/1C]MBY5306993.1 hypothetical protein [Anabaena sp. CCAP 1446/1C]MCM2406011.1 hypothetical protein [Anabaena sp. CCAP 1446/1C]